jgi:hypothetical protein
LSDLEASKTSNPLEVQIIRSETTQPNKRIGIDLIRIKKSLKSETQKALADKINNTTHTINIFNKKSTIKETSKNRRCNKTTLNNILNK